MRNYEHFKVQFFDLNSHKIYSYIYCGMLYTPYLHIISEQAHYFDTHSLILKIYTFSFSNKNQNETTNKLKIG